MTEPAKPDTEREVAEARNNLKGCVLNLCNHDFSGDVCFEALDRFEAAVRASERADKHVAGCRCGLVSPLGMDPQEVLALFNSGKQAADYVDPRCQRMRSPSGLGKDDGK